MLTAVDIAAKKAKLLAYHSEYIFFSFPLDNSRPQQPQQSGFAHLVVGDLLQVEVAGIDHLHAHVAIVAAAEGAPVFGVWVELVCLLSAALRRSRGCE